MLTCHTSLAKQTLHVIAGKTNVHITNLMLTFLSFHTVSKSLVPKPLHVPFRTEEDLLARAIAQGPKTVDVPASLPTPPHNNQEELR